MANPIDGNSKSTVTGMYRQFGVSYACSVIQLVLLTAHWIKAIRRVYNDMLHDYVKHPYSIIYTFIYLMLNEWADEFFSFFSSIAI